MPFIAKHLAENFVICFIIVNYLGYDLEKAVEIIKKYTPKMGRGKILDVKIKNKPIKIIADYYNSSPTSLKSAIEYLSLMNGSKYAIIGDMTELGKDSQKLHCSIAYYLNKTNIKKVFLIGQIIKNISNLIDQSIECFCYDNIEKFDISDHFFDYNSYILLKASRSLHFEKILNQGVINVL